MKLWAYVVILSLILGGISSAWFIADKNGYDRAQFEQAQFIIDLNAAWKEDALLMTEKLDRVQLALIDERNTLKIKTRIIEKEVSVYVKDNSQCNYSVGAIRLYNQSWGHDQTNMSEGSHLPKAEAYKASTITQSTFIRKNIEYAAWCLSLEASFESLLLSLETLNY